MPTAPHIRRNTKLSDEQVVEVLRLYHEERWSQGRLARHFQVSVVTIGRYVRGESRQAVVDAAPVSNPDIPMPSEQTLAESMARLTQIMETTAEPAAPEEDHLEEMMRRRSAAASNAAEQARVQHKAQTAQENDNADAVIRPADTADNEAGEDPGQVPVEHRPAEAGSLVRDE